MLSHVTMSSTRRRRSPDNFLLTHSSRENSLNLHQTLREAHITPLPLPPQSIPYQSQCYHISAKAFSGINTTDIRSEIRLVSVKLTLFLFIYLQPVEWFFRYIMYYFSIETLSINLHYAIDNANGSYNYSFMSTECISPLIHASPWEIRPHLTSCSSGTHLQC